MPVHLLPAVPVGSPEQMGGGEPLHRVGIGADRPGRLPPAARYSRNEQIAAWNTPASSRLGRREHRCGSVMRFSLPLTHHLQPKPGLIRRRSEALAQKAQMLPASAGPTRPSGQNTTKVTAGSADGRRPGSRPSLTRERTAQLATLQTSWPCQAAGPWRAPQKTHKSRSRAAPTGSPRTKRHSPAHPGTPAKIVPKLSTDQR